MTQQTKMAELLTNEKSLAVRQQGIRRETLALMRLNRYAEWPLTFVLLALGVALYQYNRSPVLLIAGGACGFLAVSHWMKIRDNEKEKGNLSAGRTGEERVAERLAADLPEDMYVLNDITLKFARKSAQIDHVVVGPQGLFVIETKNWRGHVTGTGDGRFWTITREDKPGALRVMNPTKQNQHHVTILRRHLKGADIAWPDVQGVLTSASRSGVYEITNPEPPVRTIDDTVEFIRSYVPNRTYTFEEVRRVVDWLLEQA